MTKAYTHTAQYTFLYPSDLTVLLTQTEEVVVVVVVETGETIGWLFLAHQLRFHSLLH